MKWWNKPKRELPTIGQLHDEAKAAGCIVIGAEFEPHRVIVTVEGKMTALDQFTKRFETGEMYISTGHNSLKVVQTTPTYHLRVVVLAVKDA